MTCPGCGGSFKGARGLRTHQTSKFVTLACKPGASGTFWQNSAVQNVEITDEQVAEIKAKLPKLEWDTDELQRDFTVQSFLAPFVFVTRKADGVKGTLQFDHHPRRYYGWQEDA